MNEQELSELNQLALKQELLTIDFKKFVGQAQAKFQAEQKQAEMTKKVAEKIEKGK